MSPSTDATRQRILLIDDDELISGSLRQYLVLQGCAGDVAVNPGSPEGYMAAVRYHTVIVDPYLTGSILHDNAWLLDRVCALQPQASVIVLTAYAAAALESAAARIPRHRLTPQTAVRRHPGTPHPRRSAGRFWSLRVPTRLKGPSR